MSNILIPNYQYIYLAYNNLINKELPEQVFKITGQVDHNSKLFEQNKIDIGNFVDECLTLIPDPDYINDDTLIDFLENKVGYLFLRHNSLQEIYMLQTYFEKDDTTLVKVKNFKLFTKTSDGSLQDKLADGSVNFTSITPFNILLLVKLEPIYIFAINENSGPQDTNYFLDDRIFDLRTPDHLYRDTSFTRKLNWKTFIKNKVKAFSYIFQNDITEKYPLEQCVVIYSFMFYGQFDEQTEALWNVYLPYAPYGVTPDDMISYITSDNNFYIGPEIYASLEESFLIPMHYNLTLMEFGYDMPLMTSENLLIYSKTSTKGDDFWFKSANFTKEDSTKIYFFLSALFEIINDATDYNKILETSNSNENQGFFTYIFSFLNEKIWGSIKNIKFMVPLIHSIFRIINIEFKLDTENNNILNTQTIHIKHKQIASSLASGECLGFLTINR